MGGGWGECEVVRDLKPEDIGKKDRYDLIIVKLDVAYLQDQATHVFHPFQEFYKYKCSSGENFSEFIVEHQKQKQFNVGLP